MIDQANTNREWGDGNRQFRFRVTTGAPRGQPHDLVSTYYAGNPPLLDGAAGR